jgi:hypothetical protein
MQAQLDTLQKSRHQKACHAENERSAYTAWVMVINLPFPFKETSREHGGTTIDTIF